MIERNQKISTLLSEYFNSNGEATLKRRLSEAAIHQSHLPVQPSFCEWQVHQSPERFSRKFRFDQKHTVISFINECLKHEMVNKHTGTYKIDDLEVTVEVYTHDLDRITELDQEFTKSVDDIYRDVLSFGRY